MNGADSFMLTVSFVDGTSRIYFVGSTYDIS